MGSAAPSPSAARPDCRPISAVQRWAASMLRAFDELWLDGLLDLPEDRLLGTLLLQVFSDGPPLEIELRLAWWVSCESSK